jgi:hypothetical protein
VIKILSTIISKRSFVHRYQQLGPVGELPHYRADATLREGLQEAVKPLYFERGVKILFGPRSGSKVLVRALRDHLIHERW